MVREDANKYKAIDPNRTLADQLEIDSIGSSGYKSGESEFDQEFYEDF